MRNIAKPNTLPISYPLPILTRILKNNLVVKILAQDYIKYTNKSRAEPNLFGFCRAKVYRTQSIIRISREQNQIYLSSAEREYIGRSQLYGMFLRCRRIAPGSRVSGKSAFSHGQWPHSGRSPWYQCCRQQSRAA